MWWVPCQTIQETNVLDKCSCIPLGASVPAGAEQVFRLHSHESGGIWQIPSLLTQPTHHQEVGPDLFLLGRVGQHEGLGKGEIVVTLGVTKPPLV